MHLRVTSTGGGVARRRPDQSPGRHPSLGPATPPTALSNETVDVVERRVPLGVDDRVPVLGPADHAQLSDTLVRAHDDLEARAQAAHEAFAGGGMVGAAGAEERPVVGEVDLAVDAERRPAAAAPRHRRLAARGVVVHHRAHRVVATAGDRVLVVLDRLPTHHPHPRQCAASLSNRRLQSC